MNGELESNRKFARCIAIAYATVGGVALAFDFFTDQSLGALMLATLPISVVALGCLLVGPWLKGPKKFTLLKFWLTGVLLVLAISTTFSRLGAEQAKTGELIFTYSALMMSLPGSIALPFLMPWLESPIGGNVIARIMIAWTICVVIGLSEWRVLSWLSARLRSEK
jgi:hypothetical protein